MKSSAIAAANAHAFAAASASAIAAADAYAYALTDFWRDHDRHRLSAIMAAEHAGNRAVTAYYNENDPKAAAIIEAFDSVTAAQPAE